MPTFSTGWGVLGSWTSGVKHSRKFGLYSALQCEGTNESLAA
jgi:hypothetical protein